MPFDTITGTDQNDAIYATGHHAKLFGLDGNDWLVGTGGQDMIFGGHGDDTTWGYFGSDTVYGGAGNDILHASEYDTGDIGHLYGGSGNDQLFAEDITDYSYAGAGNDTVTIYFDLGGAAHGGAGTDLLVMNYIGSGLGSNPNTNALIILNGPNAGASAGLESMVLSGFEALDITTYMGDDTVQGGALADTISVYSGANTVRAMGGDDHVIYLTGAVNTLDGGTGTDTLRVIQSYPATGALIFTVTGQNATDSYGSSITGFENYQVFGSSDNDHVVLGSGHDMFAGFDGADTAYGMGGRDRLHGQAGDDILYGGNGNDVLGGGLGIDTLTGGAGADSFHFGFARMVGDRITDFAPGQDHVTMGEGVVDFALALGVVDAAHFNLDSAVGTGGQFIYRASGEPGLTALVWDINGTDAGGERLIAQFEGAPMLTAADLTIL